MPRWNPSPGLMLRFQNCCFYDLLGLHFLRNRKIRIPLETGMTFSSFWHAAISGRGAFRGPGGDGRRRCPGPARTHLAGGFGYENYLRFRSPLAIDHRL
jgi:hypothetical protein